MCEWVFRGDYNLAKDDKHIYQNGRYVYNFDVSSFEKIGDDYFKDDRNVYISYPKVNRFDFRTSVSNNFELLSVKPYAKDDKYIYMDVKRQSDFDVASFVPLDSFYSKDNNRAYYRESRIEGSGSHSFVVIDSRARISKDKNAVYYVYEKHVIPVYKADPAIFEVLNKYIAQDKQSVYELTPSVPQFYTNKKIDLRTVDNIETSRFIKDKKRVYLSGKEIIAADPKSFKRLTEIYSFDNKSVYFIDKKIKNSDPKTFRVLNNLFVTQDDQNVYYREHIIKGVDVQSFIALNNYFGKDKNNIYVFLASEQKVQVFKSADIDLFELLRGKWDAESPYAKDKYNVYYQDGRKGVIIKGADPKTFEYLGYGRGKDKNGCYVGEKKVDCK